MTGDELLMIKRIAPLVIAAVIGASLCGCSFEIPLLWEEDSSEAVTTTTSKTERTRSTTTKKVYIVKDDTEYTTTAARKGEEVDPDSMDRVSVTGTTRKKTEANVSLTTTTTTEKTQYNTLQLPKSGEYFDIAKQYRTAKETAMRFGPSNEYTSVVSLSAGASLSCYGKSGKWYYVLYDNTTYGWVEEASLEGFAKKTTTTKK